MEKLLEKQDELQRPAPPPYARATTAELEAARLLLGEQELLAALLEAVDVLAVVINEERQILFTNTALCNTLRLDPTHVASGARPGEAFGCIHAWESREGCGTAASCASCGAAMAIAASRRESEPASVECLLTIERDGAQEAREFRVKAAPLAIAGLPLTVLSFRDISNEKRREALEQLFFHDILNTITALHGYTELLREGLISDEKMALEQVSALSERLRREVADQRAMLSAEAGKLSLKLEHIHPDAILHAIAQMFSASFTARGIELEVGYEAEAPQLVTDQSLLLRVITNMVQNAFEAVVPGERVRIWTHSTENGCTFAVWSPRAIPELVSRRIFQRSFSTKGSKGRGLGTYSMKLFGERYLRGAVDFVSSEEEGTVFRIILPRSPGEAVPASSAPR